MGTPVIDSVTVSPDPVVTQATVTVAAHGTVDTVAAAGTTAAAHVVAVVGNNVPRQDHLHYTVTVDMGTVVQSGTPSVWTYTQPN